VSWFIGLSIALPLSGFGLLAYSEWRDRNTWWQTSEHPSFFQH
jgi:hypothetical protein